MLFEKACINLTSRVNFFMHHLPSGSPSERAAKIKTLAITTFAGCILVIPAPVLWYSLIWDTATCATFRMSVSNKCRDLYSQLKCYIFELLNNIHSCNDSTCTEYSVLLMCQLVTSYVVKEHWCLYCGQITTCSCSPVLHNKMHHAAVGN